MTVTLKVTVAVTVKMFDCCFISNDQNYRAGEYIDLRYAGFCPDSDRRKNNSYIDSDCDSYSG